MFRELEYAANVDTIAFASLTPTWRSMLAELRDKLILLLVYGEIPPLFEHALLQSLARAAEEEGYEHVSFDLNQPPRTRPTLFLIPSIASISVSEVLPSITKHLVESNGKSRFVVTFSAKRLGELRQNASFPLLKRYIGEFEEISQNPLGFLTQFTGLRRLPAYAERNLWKLLFYGAVLALEETVLDEEQLQQVISGLKLLETTGSRFAFYEWDALPPPSKLASLYFASMNISAAEESIARADEQFYLAKCFRHFVELEDMSQYANFVSSHAAAQLQLMSRLQEQGSASQRSTEAVEFWQRLGFKYLLCEEDPPYQSMGSVDPHIQNEPNLRRLVEKVGQIIRAPSPFEEREKFIEAARVAFDHLYLIIASQQGFKVPLVENLLNAFLSEYERRLSEYEEDELQWLILKTVNIALITYACLRLHGESLSDKAFGLFPRLWSKCLDKFGTSLTISSEQREKLWQNLRVLSSYDQRFSEVAQRLFIRAEEVTVIKAQASQALSSEDPLDAFLTLFATQLREHDFFLDVSEWRSLALPLARAYSQLDDRLLQRQASYSHEYSKTCQLPNLVSIAQEDSNFDRVFILIIDGLSYLEWKLIRHYFESLADEGICLSERYAFAPVPTYTPGNTTCLITGFHPSEIGVCDWKIKPLGQNAVDLKDEAARQIIGTIGHMLSPKHAVTLVHNQIGSNLTRLWMTLATIEEILIPATESRKAIAQVRNQIHQLEPTHKVVMIYIPDFDEAGHWYLRMDGWNEYYSLLGRRIRENLLLPIFRRAKKRREKTLAILTADHGKLCRYESKLLELAAPKSGSFDKCVALLEGYEFSKSSRHIVAWIPEKDLTGLEAAIHGVIKEQQDVIAYIGDKVARLLPYTSKTPLINPNLIILSRFGISGGGGVIGHGGSSLSEVVVPAIRFSWE